ncbi:MAG: rhomboid family intramembrane serine protease [Gemmatimonadetes bacterium]|nr:rhomboid family intramembrane serine protease [Gemmatimonadota bacterium]
MFPLRDDNPTEITPVVTFILIAACVGVWILVQGAGASEAAYIASLCQWGAIPGEVLGSIPSGTRIDLGQQASCTAGGATRITLLTSMFLHGSWMHLIGNMWFLWIFGNNVEDSMGHLRYLAFYLLTGLLAAGAHVLSDPGSGIPTVGASGAISGIMGGYLVLYPRARVKTLVPVLVLLILNVPAWAMLGYWFVVQLLSSATQSATGGGIAFWAHIGGFLAGVLLIRLFANDQLVTAKRSGVVLPRSQIRHGGWW